MLVAAVGCGGSASRAQEGLIVRADAPCWIAEPPAVAPDSIRLIFDERAAASREGWRWLLAAVTDSGRTVRCDGPASATLGAWRLEAGGSRLAADGRGVVAIAALEPGGDPRDAIDGGADLLVTADAGAVRYARARGALVVPLNARTAYGVLADASPDAFAAERLGATLAHDLLPEGSLLPARVVNALSLSCAIDTRTPARRATAPVIVFDGGDAIARALAERLVSLAAAGDSTVRQLVGDGIPKVRGVTVAHGTPAEPVTWSPAPPAIIAWPAEQLPPCTSGAMPVPLVEAGSWLVVRQGAIGVASGGGGALRLVLPSRTEETP